MDINIRPGAIQFLKKMSKIFQIVIFTASHKKYADAIINKLDQNRKYITKRLYRDSCFMAKEDVSYIYLDLYQGPKDILRCRIEEYYNSG